MHAVCCCVLYTVCYCVLIAVICCVSTVCEYFMLVLFVEACCAFDGVEFLACCDCSEHVDAVASSFVADVGVDGYVLCFGVPVVHEVIEAHVWPRFGVLFFECVEGGELLASVS